MSDAYEKLAGSRNTMWSGARRLRVGVTGHRLDRLREAGADLAVISNACANVLEQIEAMLVDSPSLHLVSSLAEGADSIAADCAMSRGWRVDAVLPLPQEDYAADFPTGEHRIAHEGRVKAASAVFELPAETPKERDRAAAYERAGRIVLAQSDILLAVWDGLPAKGRGGAAQIVAEAVLRGIPVVYINPTLPDPPTLLWDGLEEHDFGQQSVETVSRGDLRHLQALIAGLTEPPGGAGGDIELPIAGSAPRAPRFAVAYPLLLAGLGVRPLLSVLPINAKDVKARSAVAPPLSGQAACSPDRGAASQSVLDEWFKAADEQAVVTGQTFRSAYVTNFGLAAAAVLISLSGLALPMQMKPVLALLELLTIGGILALTHIGRRAQWHQRWLDQRHLAERLRCLSVASQLGDLGLRRGRAADGGWVTWAMHAAARITGLPTARVDGAHLDAVRASLLELLDSQLTYLRLDASRMRRLEHRLHRLGTVFFVSSAALCLSMFFFEVAQHLITGGLLEGMAAPLATATTIGSAALPALGAAIYGIRMQGDFAGIAERDGQLADKLQTLRTLVAGDVLEFDLLSRRVRRTTELLTEDISTWLHTYKARPLTLPG